LNAFISVHERSARERAARLDRERPDGALFGIPVAVKDNINERGRPCTAGCRAYRGRLPGEDASVVDRLKKAGAIILGRTNMHELADGVTSENPHYGPVLNPWRMDCHPGGSSGGSAVAIAAGCVPAALGTDTGGSIRIPASLCGVCGLKPSAGLVPADGVVPLSITLDTVGPLARSVPGLARMMEVLVPDPSMGMLDPADGFQDSKPAIGVLDGFGMEADPPVGVLFEEALGVLEGLGCRLTPVPIPGLSRGIKVLSTIYAPEAAHYHHRRLVEDPKGFSEEIRADLERGLALDPQQYNEALDEMNELATEVRRHSGGLDFLASPTTPHPARVIGSPNPYTYLMFTCPFNLTGQPALSVPMGLVEGLPVGLQLIGSRKGDDARVLSLGAAFESRFGFRLAPPGI
jgi:aspartyl-tRNA(Asn)/glutamyl-tRNA(Gln) amidotransferase subunit A